MLEVARMSKTDRHWQPKCYQRIRCTSPLRSDMPNTAVPINIMGLFLYPVMHELWRPQSESFFLLLFRPVLFGFMLMLFCITSLYCILISLGIGFMHSNNRTHTHTIHTCGYGYCPWNIGMFSTLLLQNWISSLNLWPLAASVSSETLVSSVLGFVQYSPLKILSVNWNVLFSLELGKFHCIIST